MKNLLQKQIKKKIQKKKFLHQLEILYGIIIMMRNLKLEIVMYVIRNYYLQIFIVVI